ncbi:MAG: DUF3987 domain-containing protein, partial [Thermogutta sp.]|nr:DUF3987 domain-containing protein [Thermogutta sp.]
WAVIVGESGSLKTPAITAALQWTERRQRRLLAEYAEDRMRFEADLVRYERDIAAWRRDKHGDDPPQKPEPPTARRVLVSDTTVEALGPILRDNPRGVLLARDELSGWLASFDRYSNAKGGDSAFWLSSHGGLSHTVDRKTSGAFYIPAAAVCVTGGIQPAVLRRVPADGNYFENGLASRLLMAFPRRRRKRWTESGVPQGAADDVGRVFDELFALQHDIAPDGEPVPHVMRLSAEAKERYIAFYQSHAEELADAEGDWAGALAKLEELPLRLSLIIHLVRWASGEPLDPDVVDAESMGSAIGLTAWHKHETRRVYDALHGDEAHDEQRQLIEWIERKGGSVSVRELYCTGPRRFRAKPGEAEEALNALAAGGFGDWENVPVGATGGRPKRVFRLRNHWNRNQNPVKHEKNGGFDAAASDSSPESTIADGGSEPDSGLESKPSLHEGANPAPPRRWGWPYYVEPCGGGRRGRGERPVLRGGRRRLLGGGMVTAQELLETLRERGCELWAEGDRLRARIPKGALD